jgi:hypothetical protein
MARERMLPRHGVSACNLVIVTVIRRSAPARGASVGTFTQIRGGKVADKSVGQQFTLTPSIARIFL